MRSNMLGYRRIMRHLSTRHTHMRINSNYSKEHWHLNNNRRKLIRKRYNS